MNKWTPTTNLMMLRRMGKLQEELAELSSVAARCIIQGIDEVDPGSGQINRMRLEHELADVLAQCECTIESLSLDKLKINRRAHQKRGQMAEWEAMFREPPAPGVWPIGTLLRYDSGETALMRVTSVSVGHGGSKARYYGQQCFGGAVGAYHEQCSEATDEDRATWQRCQTP